MIAYAFFHEKYRFEPFKLIFVSFQLDKGEILKTNKNEFEWLKTIFFMKEGIRDHFAKFQVI